MKRFENVSKTLLFKKLLYECLQFWLIYVIVLSAWSILGRCKVTGRCPEIAQGSNLRAGLKCLEVFLQGRGADQSRSGIWIPGVPARAPEFNRHETGVIQQRLDTDLIQGGNGKSVALADLLKELDEITAPANVDASIFAQLKSALAEELSINEYSGLTSPAPDADWSVRDTPVKKFVFIPPTSPANRVTDLTLTDNGDDPFVAYALPQPAENPHWCAFRALTQRVVREGF